MVEVISDGVYVSSVWYKWCVDVLCVSGLCVGSGVKDSGCGCVCG